jgi:hypothetical protein
MAERMNFSSPFIARPIATTLLTLGIALAGALAADIFKKRDDSRSIEAVSGQKGDLGADLG